MKKYLILIAILFVITCVVTINLQSKKIKRQKENIERIESNNFQLLSDSRQQTELFLKEKEVTGRIKRERDSLALIIKIKPKFITKIVTIDNSIHDTIPVPVPVKITGKNEWMIRDSTECLKIVYNAKLTEDSLIVKREFLEYDNNPIQVFYRERPHKFLFIKFGKWQYKQVVKTKCEEPRIETINFVK